ncbi:MAG: hypothetical protein QXU18_08090 [Thermoplasmatales archaeon]
MTDVVKDVVRFGQLVVLIGLMILGIIAPIGLVILYYKFSRVYYKWGLVGLFLTGLLVWWMTSWNVASYDFPLQIIQIIVIIVFGGEVVVAIPLGIYKLFRRTETDYRFIDAETSLGGFLVFIALTIPTMIFAVLWQFQSITDSNGFLIFAWYITLIISIITIPLAFLTIVRSVLYSAKKDPNK